MAQTKNGKLAVFRPTRQKPARILIVDDHELIRKGLCACIQPYPELVVCGEAENSAEALRLISTTKPHVVVVDISLPGPSGIDLIRDIQLHHNGLRILVLSMHDEHVYAERAIRAGARGYVMKQESIQRLIEGMLAVLRGDLFVSPEIAKTLMHNYFYGASQNPQHLGVESLSDRELQVFDSIGRGQSTQEIAERLFLSPKTVDTYRSNIKRKLGLERNNNLVHAAVYWVEHEGQAIAVPPVREA